jgi:hypothetical protein
LPQRDPYRHDLLVRQASREDALAAVREFHRHHGRLPIKREWDQAVPGRPRARTIERRWGWRALLAEAVGIEPDEVDQGWDATMDERFGGMLDALRQARAELGRWPLASEWEDSGRRPARRTFMRCFGSWEETCQAAGSKWIATVA